MRRRLSVAMLAVIALTALPTAAQAANGGMDDGFWYNVLGLIGLLGLRGLWRDSDNDGYTDDPV